MSNSLFFALKYVLQLVVVLVESHGRMANMALAKLGQLVLWVVVKMQKPRHAEASSI